MKYLIAALVTFFLTFQLSGQNSPEAYSRIKIDLRYTSISAVASLGLETDHGNYAKGKHLINDFSEREMERLRENNIPFEILIEDVKAHYVNQNHAGHQHAVSSQVQVRGLGDCGEDSATQYDYVTPTNYEYGSMGGYLTYDELLETLDTMAALYPNLISTKQPIGNTLTHEGRPIYWLRLSDNPNVEENEPEVLYTALHHAREPNSLSQMVFYIWYLLENYETNEEVKYLVDNTEMFFIPCINPDGYIYNETIDPNGGGLWRKNRWADNGTVFGVDLNRNYAYEWGFDDQGSSTNPNSDAFRGTAGFSEPETQAVRDFCNEHEFKIALNYHAFGNLLLYPWGYSNQTTVDQPTFAAFGEAMTKENNYFAGTALETVGYLANGVSDDWMYGEATSKPPIFSFTPEVGDVNFGFWPPQNQIDRLNKSALLQNLTTAHLLLNYGEATEVNPENILTNREGSLEMNLKKYGLLAGELSLTVSAIGNNVAVSNNANTWDLVHLEEMSTTINYTISDDALDGEEILFLVQVDNGEFISSDTLKKTFLDGTFEILLADDGTNTAAWEMNDDWSTTDVDFVSSPVSYTDSPNGNYEGNINSTMTLEEPIDLENATQALLNFYTKWEIEAGYDYAQVMASTNGINFTPLCGKYTKTGNGNQDQGEPLYDGGQSEWVLEEINLSDFLGEKVWIRFRIISDGGVEGDGFYFDDWSVKVVVDNSTSLEETQLVNEFRVFPNPFEEALYVNLELSEPTQNLKFRLVNALGQVVYEDVQENISEGKSQFIIKEKDLAEGIYFLQLLVDEIKLETRRIIKLK